MATFTKINNFVLDVANNTHNWGTDTFAVALTTHAQIPVAATSTDLGSITPISYTNLSTRSIGTATSSTQTTGTYKLVLPDLTLTATGAVATFRHVVPYNDTSTTDRLICWYDYGSDVTMANGETFLIDFDASAGFLTIA